MASDEAIKPLYGHIYDYNTVSRYIHYDFVPNRVRGVNSCVVIVTRKRVAGELSHLSFIYHILRHDFLINYSFLQ